MPTNPPPQRTPLRRLSQGSLFRLSRSGAYPDAPHGLGFLEPALSELIDEAEALHTNVEGLKNLSDALGTFNESFASWLYVMNMNALTTDWPQAPTESSYKLAARRAEEDAIAAMEALKIANAPPAPPSPEVSMVDRTALTADVENEATYAANTTASSATAKAAPAKGAIKKKGKPKMSAKEKKERSLARPGIAPAYGDGHRGMMDNADRGVGIVELVKAPDLSQARVNKCLIALVNRKAVRKDNTSGAVLYHWHGLPG
ncbi:hypothetical protein A0H81_13321 [Grifola frondosa]|uniref:DASH complex subunit DAM1 n=1 Tax=Grifola frondosa TaxID=5627 RepID=A0A1C7LS37_GRIFR|nr:hypothetical protein A0H81_13321 [Grifola frondosa]